MVKGNLEVQLRLYCKLTLNRGGEGRNMQIKAIPIIMWPYSITIWLRHWESESLFSIISYVKN